MNTVPYNSRRQFPASPKRGNKDPVQGPRNKKRNFWKTAEKVMKVVGWVSIILGLPLTIWSIWLLIHHIGR